MRSLRSRSPKNTKTRRWHALLAAIVAFVGVLTGISPGAPRRADLDEARERLLELERDFQLVSEEYNLVSEQLAGIQASIGEAELEVNRLKRKMTVRRNSAVALARELYKAGSGTTLEAILSSQTLADVEARLQYLSSSRSAQTQVFERLAVDQLELDKKIGSLEEARAEALTKQDRLAELRAEIEAKVATQEDEIAELNAAIEAAERRREQRAAEAAAAAAAAAPVGATNITAKASNPRAQTAVDAALAQVGKPYQWGGSGPDSYDCSGLTMYAWAQAGVSLPHHSGSQYAATARVAQSDWEPGDLLFFGSPIHHVGMYIGGGRMVEAPYSGQRVRVSSAYRSDYVGAGRPGV